MQIYLDESGDLGWKFDKPNRDGGSSRFITISGIIIHEDEFKHVKRLISDIYRKYKLTPKIEKKGCHFSNEHANFVVSQLNKLKSKAPSLRVISITAYKEKVYPALRIDTNILYNYLTRMLVSDVIKGFSEVEIILDKRTIKVDHGNNFEAYIKTILWGEMGSSVNISCKYIDSNNNEGIWFADWMANWVWRQYENQDVSPYQSLVKQPHIFTEKKLYFP